MTFTLMFALSILLQRLSIADRSVECALVTFQQLLMFWIAINLHEKPSFLFEYGPFYVTTGQFGIESDSVVT